MITKTTIKLPMYECSIIIMIVDSVSEEADKLYKKFKIDLDFGDEAEGALLFLESDKYHLLFHKEFLSHNTIAHEVFHAAVRVTEDRDVVDEEAQAWLTGHITELIYKFLEKKNLPVKHG